MIFLSSGDSGVSQSCNHAQYSNPMRIRIPFVLFSSEHTLTETSGHQKEPRGSADWKDCPSIELHRMLARLPQSKKTSLGHNTCIITNY
jgi:hypothetical protein